MIRLILNFGIVFLFYFCFSMITTGIVVGSPLGDCENRGFNKTYNVTDSDECDKYYICEPTDWKFSVHFCKPGFRYSPKFERCDEAKKVNCSGRHFNPRALIKPESCTIEQGRFLCTYGKECIRRDQICDGFFDCLDASDEFENCESACAATSCIGNCVPTPSNGTSAPGTCVCREGYTVSPSNSSECVDLNECEVFGFCSQLCENSIGSYKCSCMEGFEIPNNNNKSCVPKDRKWSLIYATKSQVGLITSSRGTEKKYRITPDAGRPVAVTYDARKNVTYWTDASKYDEAIYKGSLGPNSSIEVVADTGLLLPEGIALDWITGNIYFADSNLSHIAVCSNSSNLCSVLIHQVIDKPRDIALHPNMGIMFWSDWGNIPAIMRAGMDGTNPQMIVSENLQWPNGIAIDYGGSRIYWVDAYRDKIESSRFDGSDRQVVVQKSMKHPFGIDILGDRIFWSDWNTMEIKSANKFTGLDSKVHDFDQYTTFNGVAVFHPANQLITRSNPCARKPCSHICTLTPTSSSFRCLCPVGMVLESDSRTCTEPEDLPKLVIAFKSTLKTMRFGSIGRDVVDSIPLPTIKSISALVYNPINHTIILSDSGSKKIYEYIINRKKLNVLIDQHLDSVKGMDIDVVGENLYWVDGGKQTVEVMSFRTRARAVLMTGVENPYDILVVPELRALFLARMGSRVGKIYRMWPNGFSSNTIKRVGDKEPIALTYDKEFGNIIWADKVYRGIESVSSDGLTSSTISINQEGPPTDVVKYKNHIFWIDMFSQTLKTIDFAASSPRLIRIGSFESNSTSSNNNTSFFAKMTVINKDLSTLDDVISKHECSYKNEKRKNCSHICLLENEGLGGVCHCPEGLHLDEDGATCVKLSTCSQDQFTCSDGNCISRQYICDGISDCTHNDDEVNCNEASCAQGHFKCEANGVCIPTHWVCDGENDCVDAADEGNCTYVPCNEDFDFRCESSGRCIPKSWQCDHAYDCPGDDSDERGCNFSCPDGFFQCTKSQHCIIADWVCDGEKDCEDGSDEHEFCAERSCLPTEFMCNSGKCINNTFVCDGHPNCAFKEDEEHCEDPNGVEGRSHEGDSSMNITFVPVSESSEGGGNGTTIAIVLGVIIIIILVGIIIGLVMHKRNIQPKVLVRPYVQQWNKYVYDPTRRLFTDGRGQQKLDCELNPYDETAFGATACYNNSAVYEEVDGATDYEPPSSPEKRAQKDAASRSLVDSGILNSERESLYDEAEDCGSHYVSYNQKDKLIPM